MKKLFILNGYIWMLLLPIVIWRFQLDGTVNTKWGRFSGESARDALVAYVVIACIFGWYSIKETIAWIKSKRTKS